MSTTSRRRPRPAPLARLHAGTVPSRRGETARTLLIAAALVALLLAIVGLAVIGGGRDRSPLLGDATATPATASTPPSTEPILSGPADDALRATWIANTRELPLLGTGAGPVSMTIAANGTGLSAANFAPGATFDSTISQLDNGTMKLSLDRASGGCQPGAIGTYALSLTDDGSLLSLVPHGDECPTRAEALGRTWARSLAGSTSRGSGFVTTMNPAFSVKLPDQTLSARTLADMIEIGGENGFSLMAFRNPQGFVDACSTDDKRVPYTPGAKAFADYLERNPSLKTLLREQLTIGGLPATHVITTIKLKAEGARCDEPSTGLHLWTPKDCDCHFTGGDDSLYIVDLPSGDTMMFEVSPVDVVNPVERQIIDSIQIPATLPGS